MSEEPRNEPIRSKVLLTIASIGLAVAGIIFDNGSFLEAWLFAYVTLAGLLAGSLGLLMIGHLLGEYWLRPVRHELESAARTTPLLAILAIPIGFELDQLFPWTAADMQLAIPEIRRSYFDPVFFLVRSAVYLAVWIALAFWVARPGEHRGRSAVGLALLAPTATLAGIDWVMSRDPLWWSSLFGLAFAVTQLLPALAGAVLLTILRPDMPDRKRLRSLERALMTIALMTLWLWFVQFLIVWMANLPDEVIWYIVRYETWGWVMLWVALPAMIAGILALLPPIIGGLLLRGAVSLFLVQHVGHMLWLVKPEMEGIFWPALAMVGLAAIWTLWLTSVLAGRPNVRYGAEPD